MGAGVVSEAFAPVSINDPKVCNDFIMMVFVPHTNSTPRRGSGTTTVDLTRSVVLVDFFALELAKAGDLTEEEIVIDAVAVV